MGNQIVPTIAMFMGGAALGVAGTSTAQQGDGTYVPIATAIVKPDKVDATPERMRAIKAPPGFAVTPFATGLKNIRVVAIAPDGTIYLSRRDQGDVLMLKDADGDGRADGPAVTVANRPGAHGLAIQDGKLYLATAKEIFIANIRADGKLSALTMIIGDLPDAGQHANRTLAFGPDKMLYISAGSTCNSCNESNQENATLLRASPDGKQRTIFAKGLRNTIGFDWEPRTGELWGMDHGIDFLGDDEQAEELNHLQAGKQYGWPHVYGSGTIYPQGTPPGGITKAQWKAQSEPMVMGYTAHAAPMQMLFYRGTNFPAEYQGDAFVTMRGSWNRSTPSGYEVVRVRFANGQATSMESFVTGFLTDGGRTHIARPVGLAMAKDGALLMADDANGVLYRIAYAGGNRATSALPAPPAASMQQQAQRGTKVPLALTRVVTASPGKLTVHSTAFEQAALMPGKLSDYADGVSPPLSWSATPGALSYALIVEDPDAPQRPVVHWVAWNIPASTTKLPEGLQEQARLTDPEGMLQGRTTRGSVGYVGPRPPPGDPAHHYHFQVFALDALLSVPFGSDRDQLLAAMQGHVLARGELMGRYAQTQTPSK
jgi:Raf kinase inhibitor-like YbhB/YbcL family protein